MKKQIMLVSMILGMLFILPMVSASSFELVKGWNLVEFKEDIDWVDIKYSNGSEELNITDAGDADWVQKIIQYYEDNHWRTVFIGIHPITKQPITGDTTVLENGRGYLIYVAQDGISIVVDKPNKVKVKFYNPEKKNKKLFEED